MGAHQMLTFGCYPRNQFCVVLWSNVFLDLAETSRVRVKRAGPRRQVLVLETRLTSLLSVGIITFLRQLLDIRDAHDGWHGSPISIPDI